MKFRKVCIATGLCFIIYFLPSNIFSDDIQKANKYYEKYDFKLALEIYEKIMQKKPSLDVAQKLANCYRFINDSENAEQAYAKVLTFPGFEPVVYKYLAEVLKQNGKYDQAKENYLLFAKAYPALADETTKMANSCDVAKMWADNPDNNVKIASEEVLNSEYSEFSPVVVNKATYFVSDRWFAEGSAGKKKEVYGWTGNPYLKIYQYNKSSTQAISILPKEINAEYHNGPAVFNIKGDTVFLTRTSLPGKSKKKKKELIVGKKSIWFAVKTDKGWSQTKMLTLSNDVNYSAQHPALSPQGNILYFASDMPGGFGGMDIYYSKKQTDGNWGNPTNCGPDVNTAEDEVFPFVRADGKFYFSSKGHVGMGGLDIFTADEQSGKFTMAENLKSPLNSSKDDFGVWFTDSISGFISSNRKGGKGLDDIYNFKIVPAKQVLAIEGEVIDKATSSPLTGINIVLENLSTGRKMNLPTNAEGKFRFELDPGTDYIVSGDKDKFYSRQEGKISTKGITGATIFNVKFELERAKDALIVTLNNIYYDFNKWNIRQDAKPELNKVVSFLASMSNINIELRSHTDARGPAVYNKSLSQKRAQSAIDYLIIKNVASNRLTAVGLGETELLNRCRNGVKCSKGEHQLNRRTEFKVIKVNPVLSMNNKEKEDAN